MRDVFAILALFALLWVTFRTDIPSKAVVAVEAWLDAQAASSTKGDV